MLELATLTAALTMLSTSLGGLQQKIAAKLASSDATAVQQAVARARFVGASGTGARSAFESAPYRLPALRYVFVSGWIAGTKSSTACALARLSPGGMRSDTETALRRDVGSLRQLRRLHLTVAQAATAFTRGVVSACG